MYPPGVQNTTGSLSDTGRTRLIDDTFPQRPPSPGGRRAGGRMNRVGPDARRRALPLLAATELAATLRTVAWPLTRWIRPLPAPVSDGARAPVVLVHGWLGHPDTFLPLQRRLHEAGFGQVERVGYPSTRLSLDRIAARIDAVCVPLARRSGPVDLVGHSLGAVACRAWIKVFGGAAHVRRFVSLGGPHGGTALFRLAPRILHDALDPDGSWVARLAEGPEPVPTTVIRAARDHQILPSVRAALPGAEEIVLTGHGHNGLLWSRTAHRLVIDALLASDPPVSTGPP